MACHKLERTNNPRKILRIKIWQKIYRRIPSKAWINLQRIIIYLPYFSVMSNSSQPHGLQHTRLLHPSPSPELAQTHVHWVGDDIQPSHPLSSSSPAFKLSQHQGLFQWVSSWQQVAKVLELQFQHQSFQWIFRIDFLYYWQVWSPCSWRDSQESSPTPQLKAINSWALSLLYGTALTSILEKP